MFSALGCFATQSRRVGFCSVLALLSLCSIGEVDAQASSFEHGVTAEITPEALRELQLGGVAVLTVDAQQASGVTLPAQSPMRVVYFTNSPSFRAAREAVLRDYGASTLRDSSQRLTGTPSDWLRVGLSFTGNNNSKLERPLVISPQILSEAIKDDVDMQIIDLRSAPTGVTPQKSTSSTVAIASFSSKAVNLLPHQLEAELPKMSKLRWTVLVDDGNRVAQPIADRMFQQGYHLVCILDGGYPAWISATNR